jgi:hypothetical protein
MSCLRGINIASNAFIDRTCLYFTLMAYVLMGNVISAKKVFSMVQYFTILQNLLVYNYPRAMFSAAEARVSIKRIEVFYLFIYFYYLIEFIIINKTITANESLILTRITLKFNRSVVCYKT